jgi:hypothetical protein
MIAGNEITPNGSISEEDKKIIIQSVEYLSMTDEIKQIEALGADFEIGRDFYNTFGFNEYDMQQNAQQNVSVFLNESSAIDIYGYDVLANAYISSDGNDSGTICEISRSDKNYILEKEKSANEYDIALVDTNKNEIIRFNAEQFFSRYQNYAQIKEGISEKDATFIIENDKVKIKFIIKNVSMGKQSDTGSYYADFYILIKFK